MCIILQVLINLIIHDMDAVNDGWDRLVSLTARFNGMQTNEIVVGDTGHRIPADKLQQVFDPFFATKAGGMGMGPPISRTIIEAHGGRLGEQERWWGRVSSHSAHCGGGFFKMSVTNAQSTAALSWSESVRDVQGADRY